MRHHVTTYALAMILLGSLPAAAAQAPRTDYIWARTTAGQHITLDGVLNEPAWALAESKTITWGVDNGYPGSGQKPEGGVLPKDPTHATLKFLVDADTLFLAVIVPDSSIGGSYEFNREDGLLMMVMDHLSTSRPTPPLEHYYSWWFPNDTLGAMTPGREPSFRGAWADFPPGSPRTPTQIANWDAKTVVNGLSNADSAAGVPTPDVGYTVEMKFNLAADGYHPQLVGGDVVEWSISIYDVDWYWHINLSKFSANRVWWQNPWGNTSWYDEVKIYTRPDITINTAGPLPPPGADLVIPDGAAYAAPAIDGRLLESVWAWAPSFDIRYNDTPLRDSYPNTGKFRSGQYQPTVNGGLAGVIDPGDCTVKYFFKGTTLYLGFDVRDIAVQYYPVEDRWDGISVTLNEKTLRGADKQILGRRLAFQVGSDGKALAQYYLPYLRDTVGGAQVQISLNSGTVVDTISNMADNGYTAELAVDLTKLGYPASLGDGVVLMGITLYDGDSFVPFTDSYATRTWWFREYEGENGPAWCQLDIPLLLGVGDPAGAGPPVRFALLGSQPNPFSSRTVLRYALPEPSVVTLEVFDVSGRRVRTQLIGMQSAGEQTAALTGRGLGTGLYLYRLEFAHPVTGAAQATLAGKVILVE